VTLPYTDGLIEAKEAHPGWVAIFWLYPGKQKYTAWKTVMWLEDKIKAAGYKGWLADSGYQFKAMHKVLLKHGCYPYWGDAKRIYFKKEVN
jgi:hypothetical protein